MADVPFLDTRFGLHGSQTYASAAFTAEARRGPRLPGRRRDGVRGSNVLFLAGASAIPELRSTPPASTGGVGEAWFDSLDDALVAFAAQPSARLLVEDRGKFVDKGQSRFVEDQTHVPPSFGS